MTQVDRNKKRKAIQYNVTSCDCRIFKWLLNSNRVKKSVKFDMVTNKKGLSEDYEPVKHVFRIIK